MRLVQSRAGISRLCGWPRWCGGAAACWLDRESCCPWSRCRAWGPLGLLPGCCRPWLCCGGLGFCGVAVGVSINRVQHESLRATCTTLAVGQCPWGTINPPDAPGLVVAGSRWALSVPRLFLCVGALHPIRRQCTSSVRVQCPLSGVAPPRLWRLSGLWGSSGLELSSAWGLCGTSCCFLRNVACNSPARTSNVEIASLELQRFRVLQKVRAPELHASFGLIGWG